MRNQITLENRQVHMLFVDVAPVVHEVDVADERVAELEEHPPLPRPASVLVERLPHALDGLAHLERRAQLHGHGGAQVVHLEQHQRLPVDLLQLEIGHVLGAPGLLLDEVAHALHAPLKRVVLQDVGGVGHARDGRRRRRRLRRGRGGAGGGGGGGGCLVGRLDEVAVGVGVQLGSFRGYLAAILACNGEGAEFHATAQK